MVRSLGFSFGFDYPDTNQVVGVVAEIGTLPTSIHPVSNIRTPEVHRLRIQTSHNPVAFQHG